MLAIARTTTKSTEGMRPFDMRRDLAPLADLVELTFASDPDGMCRSVVSEMRRAARTGPALWLAAASDSGNGSMMGGYVWMAGKRLVGNVTLCRDSSYADLWVISNVAVHPDYRRRGIAEQLLTAALLDAARRRARAVVLEVQKENQVARHLYDRLGFVIYDSVAELCRSASTGTTAQLRTSEPGAESAVRRQRAGDCRGLCDLLRQVTPPAAQAIRPVRESDFRPGLGARLDRLLDDWLFRRQHGSWVLERGGGIAALLQITGQYAYDSHRLKLIVRPSERGALEEPLLSFGLSWLARFPDRPAWAVVSCSHPEALSCFERSGFKTMRVLDQMQIRPTTLSESPTGARK